MQVLDEESRSLNEYLLIPNLTTRDCTPDNVDLSAPLVRHQVGEVARIRVAVPLVSAIMEAVSSPRLAIGLAQCGGLGFIHQNQSVEAQAGMVEQVKRNKAGFRHSEATIKPTGTLGEVALLLAESNQDVAVVTEDGSPNGVFLGLISTNDFHPQRHRMDDTVETRMRPAGQVPTAGAAVSLSEANALIWQHRVDVLPILAGDGRLQSVVLRRDYLLHKRFRNESIDADKRFRVAAGVNTRDYRDRIPALVAAGADLLCIDSSDGYSVWQQDTLHYVRRDLQDQLGADVPIGAGNVVDGRGFRFLAEAGADFVKVGIGGGSICITRDAKGIGRGQASALLDVVAARDAYAAETGHYVPVCCDGGLLQDYHLAIALAMGADFIMLGRYFARFDESPSRKILINGHLFKEYWGEGSQRAKNSARYSHAEADLVFEEGVDGYVPYAGNLYDNLALTLAKLKATMVSCGSTTLRQFHDTAVLTRISAPSYTQNTAEIDIRDRPVNP